jgi:dihydrodipicolinate synthase/N-acetylneuraminate lyase
MWRERDAVSAAEIDELRELRATIASVPMVAAVKSLVNIRMGRDEWRRILPPLMALSGENQQLIETVADRLGHSH